MVDIHGADYGLGGDLSEDEITVIRGALDLSNKTAITCMTPLEKVGGPSPYPWSWSFLLSQRCTWEL